MSVVKATLRMKPRLRPRSRISRLATSQMLRQRGITPPPGSRLAGSGVTASMNSSDSFGGSYENVRTSPAARARASRPSRSTSRSTSSLTLSPVRSSTCSVSWPSSQSPFEPATSISRCWRPEAALSSSMAPEATIRPRAMITTSSHTSSTRSSWWLLKTTPAPAAACSRTTSVMVAMPIGSSPENGSSRTSSSGSWTSAVASWTRCWLPCDSSSSLDFARSPRPIRSSHVAGRSVGRLARHAVLLAEVAQLLGDPHPRVEAALLGHVAEPQAHVAIDRLRPSSGPRRGRAPRGRRRSASSSSCPRRSARGSRRCGPVGR